MSEQKDDNRTDGVYDKFKLKLEKIAEEGKGKNEAELYQALGEHLSSKIAEKLINIINDYNKKLTLYDDIIDRHSRQIGSILKQQMIQQVKMTTTLKTIGWVFGVGSAILTILNGIIAFIK